MTVLLDERVLTWEKSPFARGAANCEDVDVLQHKGHVKLLGAHSTS